MLAGSTIAPTSSGQPPCTRLRLVTEPKTPGLDAAVYASMLASTTPPDQVLVDLAAVTRARMRSRAGMLVSPEQGAFLTVLARLGRARLAVELGTFTGYSAICIARGLAPGGRLIAIDNDPRVHELAPGYWFKAGVADRIELRIGDAIETLGELPAEPSIDLAFVDADKHENPRYLELLLDRLSPDGVIAVDNTLWHGAVVEPPAEHDPTTAAIVAFNAAVAADPRLDVVQLAIGDGLTLIQHRR